MSGKSVALKIREIYPAILGESASAGYPCVIVRLSGCNLRCSYCDTRYAYSGGRRIAVSHVVSSVAGRGLHLALVTGGEPLLQPETASLLSGLLTSGIKPVLETNGSVDLSPVPKGVRIVMDLKTPGSGHASANLIENLDRLKKDDEIKFVVVDRKDYLWARRMIATHELHGRFQVIISPAFNKLVPAELASWMLKDRLEARLGLQVHKYIFGAGARRV